MSTLHRTTSSVASLILGKNGGIVTEPQNRRRTATPVNACPVAIQGLRFQSAVEREMIRLAGACSQRS